jgi:ABC-type nitrate/sulfonate/bicarbonate transport system substrate-binding protein
MVKIITLTLSVIILLGLAKSIPAQDVVKLGSFPIAAELPFHAALAQGYLGQEGIKVELLPVVGGAAAIPALIRGSLQLGHSA